LKKKGKGNKGGTAGKKLKDVGYTHYNVRQKHQIIVKNSKGQGGKAVG